MTSYLRAASLFAAAAAFAVGAFSGARAAPAPPLEPFAPYAVAAGPNDEIDVADPGTQRIFAGRLGALAVLAGSGMPGPSGIVPGGFADGPAGQARFDDPLGIARAGDGSVLVADSGNHCIRRIAGGMVTTYAGDHDESGATDGALLTARFRRPVAIASDGTGTLYVADAGVGIRRIAEGSVSTVAIPGVGTNVRAVGAFERDGKTTLFIGSTDGIVTFDLERGTLVRFGKRAKDLERAEGVPIGVVMLDPHTALFADPRSRTIRMLYALAGTAGFDEDYSQAVPDRDLREDESGFASGRGSTAAGTPELQEPTGVALLSSGRLVVTDPAAKRIVELPAPDRRHPVSDDVADLALDGTASYRIALVGNSFAYFNTSYARSIGATIENDLNAAPASGLPKPARVLTVRISASSTTQDADYIDNFLPGTVDLVVWLFNDIHVLAQTYDHPEALPSSQPYAPTVIAAMQNAQRALSAERTSFIVVYQPISDGASVLEQTYGRDTTTIRFARNSITDGVRDALARSGVPTIDLLPQVVALEARPDRRPLFGTQNGHLSVAGDATVAHAIARALLERRPWAH